MPQQSTLDGWYRRPTGNETSNRGSHRGGRGRGHGGGRGGESHRGGSHRGRGGGRGLHGSGNRMTEAQLERRRTLKAVADETKEILPTILSDIPAFNAASSSIHDLKNLPPLDPKDCPGFTLPPGDPHEGAKGTRIRVLNQDSFDAALDLTHNLTAGSYLSSKPWLSNNAPVTTNKKDSDNDTQMTNADDTPSQSTQKPSPKPAKPAAVLNLASERHPGGGWQNGALAQEEALCYRSSLYLSLHKSYYPLPSLSAIYTPAVLIIRSNMASDHTLLYPSDRALDLPIASVITLAALRHPEVTTDWKYKNEGARSETKRKIRVILRVAAHGGHTKLVLGALGCGVFGNPRGEVARCFLEVMHEQEFAGGWWEDVVFAVLDSETGPGSNIGVFSRELEGQVV